MTVRKTKRCISAFLDKCEKVIIYTKLHQIFYNTKIFISIYFIIFPNNNMTLHEEQIKNKLLNEEIDHYRKLYYEEKKQHKMNHVGIKIQPPSDFSEWSTNQKSATFMSFPHLKFNTQSLRKSDSKGMESKQNETFISACFTKLNYKPKEIKSSMPRQINLSFNTEQRKVVKKRNRKLSNPLQNDFIKNLQKAKKESLQNYLINGKIKVTSLENKSPKNVIDRTEHLLRLLRQRQVLRMRRYSFDIDAGIRAKSCLSP